MKNLRPLNKYFSFAALLLSVVPASNAIAGSATSGGGQVLYCGEARIKETGVYPGNSVMLDLYEGPIRHGYEIPRGEADKEKDDETEMFGAIRILAEKIEKVKKTKTKLALKILEQLHYLQSHTHFLPKSSLELVPGAYPIFKPIGCNYLQLANWTTEADGREEIWVDDDLFHTLKTDLDIAAFFFHEAAFKVSRDSIDAKDSVVVSQFVAEVFSNKDTVETEIAKKEDTYYQGLYFWDKDEPHAHGEGHRYLSGDRIYVRDDRANMAGVDFQDPNCLKGLQYSLALEPKGDFDFTFHYPDESGNTIKLKRKKDQLEPIMLPGIGRGASKLIRIYADFSGESTRKDGPVLDLIASSTSCSERFTLRMRFSNLDFNDLLLL